MPLEFFVTSCGTRMAAQRSRNKLEYFLNSQLFVFFIKYIVTNFYREQLVQQIQYLLILLSIRLFIYVLKDVQYYLSDVKHSLLSDLRYTPQFMFTSSSVRSSFSSGRKFVRYCVNGSVLKMFNRLPTWTETEFALHSHSSFMLRVTSCNSQILCETTKTMTEL